MTTHLVTVGTSLLGNARRHLGRGREAGVNHNELVAFLAEAAPAKASAETNSLHRALGAGDRLVFFPSDTDDGRACSAALVHHYRHAGHDTEEAPVPGLTYDAGSFAADGLRGLAALLVQQTDRNRRAGRAVRICATGGFKAEAALATLVGLLFGAEVYYIHEAFDDLVTLPPLPISWDFTLAHDHRDLLEWLMDPRPENEVEQRLKGRPPEFRSLLTSTPRGLELSAVGFVLLAAEYDRPSTRPGADVRLSGKARAVYDDHPGSRTKFDDYLERLGDPTLRDSQSERLQGKGGYVYPRGHVAERVVYDLDGGVVFVCELLPGHARGTAWGERYNVLRRDGVDQGDYEGFTAWARATEQLEPTGDVEPMLEGAGSADEARSASESSSPEKPRPARRSAPAPQAPRPSRTPGPTGSGRTMADLLSEDVLRKLRDQSP